MWTICYTAHDGDHYERVPLKELQGKLRSLCSTRGVNKDEILIFHPGSEYSFEQAMAITTLVTKFPPISEP